MIRIYTAIGKRKKIERNAKKHGVVLGGLFEFSEFIKNVLIITFACVCNTFIPTIVNALLILHLTEVVLTRALFALFE